jgi:hypothetical protein
VEKSNQLPLWLRWWGLAAGAATLFWLPVEDTTLTKLGLVSAAWTVWLAGWIDLRPRLRRRLPDEVWRKALAGGLAGVLLPVIALLLVVLKAGLHGHGFLDFSFYQLGKLLVRTPIWVGVGGLGGLLFGKFSRM